MHFFKIPSIAESKCLLAVLSSGVRGKQASDNKKKKEI